MANIERYNNIFMEMIEVKEEELNENLVYQSVPAWDSVGHMGLIASLEEEFSIMLDTDDIIDFSSYEKGKQILKKYEIEF